MTVITPSPGAPGSGPGASAPPPAEELRPLDAHWRPADLLPTGQICLLANPLPREPRLLGHGGVSPCSLSSGSGLAGPCLRSLLVSFGAV